MFQGPVSQDDHQQSGGRSDEKGRAAPKPSGERLSKIFGKVAGFLSRNKQQAASIAIPLLLSTTALTAPLLASTAGAVALMAATFYFLMHTSDAVVDNISAAGEKLGVDQTFMGIVLGAVTSLPELLVTAGAIMSGAAALGMGNVVGSNIANILLILGVTAAIRNMPADKGLSWKFNAATMMAATAGFGAQIALGSLSMPMGIAMIGALGGHMAISYFLAKRDAGKEKNALEEEQGAQSQGDAQKASAEEGEGPPSASQTPLWLNLLWAGAGVAGLVTTAGLLVSSGSAVALGLGVSAALVGTLAVALGTSVPELVVNIKAALKGNAKMAIGNVVGSNIFNILMVGGAMALAGVTVPAEFGLETARGLVNTGAFLLSAAALTVALKANQGGLKRWHGFAALGSYAAFVAASIFMDGAAAADIPEASGEIEAPPPAEEPAGGAMPQGERPAPQP